MKRTRPTFRIKRYVVAIAVWALVLSLFIYLIIVLKDYRVESTICLLILMGVAGVLIGLVVINYRESYSICNGEIIVKRGKKRSVYAIPQKCILVLSHADEGPGITRYGPFRNNDTAYSDVYSVSIIKETRETNCDYIKQTIKKWPGILTPEVIRKFFSWRYVYSFVLDYDSLDQLEMNSTITILVPSNLDEDIKNKLSKFQCDDY